MTEQKESRVLYVDFIAQKAITYEEFLLCPTACKYVEDLEGLEELEEEIFQFVDNNPFYAVDIEIARIDGRKIVRGSGIEWATDIFCCLSMSNGEETYVIKNSHIELFHFKKYAEKIASKPWANQSLKFDMRFFLRDYGVMPPLVYDTELASRCIRSEPDKRYSLLEIISEFLGEAISKEEQISNWGQRLITVSQIAYSARDAYYVCKLVPILNEHLNAIEQAQRKNFNSPYYTVFGVNHKVFHLEMAVIPIFCQMEHNGIYIDYEQVEKKMAEALIVEDKLIMQLITLAGEKFNPRAPAQILKLIKKLYPVQGRVNESGKTIYIRNLESTTQDDFKPFVNQGMPFVDTLYTFKKLTGNFQRLEEFYTKTNKATSRLYTAFRVWGAVSGRTSNPKPNLQNIKNDTKAAEGLLNLNLRGFFKAPPGTVLIDADYSQIQLVIIAALSRDEVMLDVITHGPETGLDLHIKTAAAISGVAESEVTKLQRQRGKAVNFGLCILPGYEVQTSMGLKKIEDIQIGDLVWTHKQRYCSVTELFHRTLTEYYIIEVMDEKTNYVYEVGCSPEHMWLLRDSWSYGFDEYWKETEYIRIGSLIVMQFSKTERRLGRVVRKDLYRQKKQDVYDFTVSGDHSFIVNNLTSHNCFGMGAPSLVEYAMNNYEVYFTLNEALEIRRKYFDTYKQVKEWHEDVLNSRRGGFYYCRDFYGREMIARDFTNATNYPVQSTEASIIKYAMVLIDKELKEYNIHKNVRLVNMIHDELLFEVDEDYADIALPIIENNMEAAGNLILKNIVPVRAEGAIISDWTMK